MQCMKSNDDTKIITRVIKLRAYDVIYNLKDL